MLSVMAEGHMCQDMSGGGGAGARTPQWILRLYNKYQLENPYKHYIP